MSIEQLAHRLALFHNPRQTTNADILLLAWNTMRIISWTRLSWWDGTRLAATGTVVVGTVLAVFIAILIAALHNSTSLTALSWITFTGFPLLIVFIIASLARIQERINIRSPQSRDERPVVKGRD